MKRYNIIGRLNEYKILYATKQTTLLTWKQTNLLNRKQTEAR
ncbi:hypothetical protein PVAP13_3NG178627 [Panicum virgatum]|uniref:Uncharacterized protein n=1 Tax=Panicum virgatum TaxID=38727 RepID=A0A8T0U5W6_PANVG|nr:hypothetical protein PVAP13_3NG178627 [Panicum virgatum]